MRCRGDGSDAVEGHSPISRMTRQGLPAANTPSGMSLVTTLPAPTTDRGPIRTPGQMIAPPPIHVSSPISTLLPRLESRPAHCSAQRVRCRIDLNGRPEQHARPDPHRRDIEHDAIEIEKHRIAERDVAPVVAVERRLDPDIAARRRDQLPDHAAALLLLIVAGLVERAEEQSGAAALGGQRRIARVVELPAQHLVFLGSHDPSMRADASRPPSFHPHACFRRACASAESSAGLPARLRRAD